MLSWDMCLIGQGQLVECTGCLVYSAQVNQNQQHQIVCIVHTSKLILSTGKVGPTRSLPSSTSPQLTLKMLCFCNTNDSQKAQEQQTTNTP